MPNKSRTKKGKFVSVWDKVEIILNEADKKGVYISRIEDIKRDGIIASRPDFISGTSLLRSNARVFIQYNRPDALYRFAAKLKQLPGDIDGRVHLSSIGKINRVQRREFVRILKRVDLIYSLLKNKSSGFVLDQLTWHNSYSKDISAGGISIRVDDDATEGDIHLIRINEYDIMGIPRFIAAICRRIFTVEDYRFGGLEFITKENLSNHFRSDEINMIPSLIKRFNAHTQNKMIRYVFDEQVKERQKGLI
jgi:c-di-GMP-binding flagellar brake protein YcgR